MERGDTGLGRDAYGIPRRDRDRRGHGPGPYPSDDGYPASAEEDDAAGSGRPVDAEEDDYGQLLRRPGEMPPRQQRLRQPGRPHPGQPARFPPGAVPPGAVPPGAVPQAPLRRTASLATAACPVTAARSASPTVRRRADLRAPAGRTAGTQMAACPTGRCRTAAPRMAAPCRSRGGVPHGAPPNSAPPNGAPHGGIPNGGPMPNGGPPNGGPVPGRQYRLPNGRRVPPNADRLYRPPGPSAPGGTSGRHHGTGPAAHDPYADSWSRPQAAPGAPPPGAPLPGGAGLEHRPQVRLTGVRSPIAPRGYPGYLGRYLGTGSQPLREHPPARPRFDGPDGRERLGPPLGPPLGPLVGPHRNRRGR